MYYFLYPSGAFCYHGPRGPTCVNLVQSALAEHILFSNYQPTALCSPLHDQFTNSVFMQYIPEANSLLSTVFLILSTVDGCVHLLTESDCSSIGSVDLNMVNNISKILKTCFLKGKTSYPSHHAHLTYTQRHAVHIKLPL